MGGLATLGGFRARSHSSGRSVRASMALLTGAIAGGCVGMALRIAAGIVPMMLLRRAGWVLVEPAKSSKTTAASNGWATSWCRREGEATVSGRTGLEYHIRQWETSRISQA